MITYSQYWRLHRHQLRRLQDSKCKDEPRLDIAHCLFQLTGGEAGLRTALTILSHAQGQYVLLPLAQESSIFGTAGYDKVENHSCGRINAPQIRNKTRQGANESELFFPMPYMRRQPTI